MQNRPTPIAKSSSHLEKIQPTSNTATPGLCPQAWPTLWRKIEHLICSARPTDTTHTGPQSGSRVASIAGLPRHLLFDADGRITMARHRHGQGSTNIFSGKVANHQNAAGWLAGWLAMRPTDGSALQERPSHRAAAAPAVAEEAASAPSPPMSPSPSSPAAAAASPLALPLAPVPLG